jgi:hypothetical protein
VEQGWIPGEVIALALLFGYAWAIGNRRANRAKQGQGDAEWHGIARRRHRDYLRRQRKRGKQDAGVASGGDGLACKLEQPREPEPFEDREVRNWREGGSSW